MAGLEVPLAAIAQQAPAFDVVVYGGTSAGVIAAVQAKKMGKSRRHRRPGQAPRRPVERRPRLHRHRQQGGHRRPVARVLPPRLAALRPTPRRGSGRSARSTATRARARRPSTARSGRCGSSSRTSPSRSSRTSSKSIGSPSHRDEWLDRAKGVKKDGRADRRRSRCSAARPTPARCSSTRPTKAT